MMGGHSRLYKVEQTQQIFCIRVHSGKPRGFLSYNVWLRLVGRLKPLEIEISCRLQRKYIASSRWIYLVWTRCCNHPIRPAIQSNLLSWISLCKWITFSVLQACRPVQVTLCVCVYGCFPAQPAWTQTYCRWAMTPPCTWLTSHHSHFPLHLKCLSGKEKITPKQIRHNINSLR